MKKNQLIGLLVVLVIVVLAIIAIAMHSGSNKSSSNNTSSTSSSSSKSSGSNNSSKAVATNSVVIQNFTFSPAAITVKVGTTVTWTNKDAVNHTVTADNPSSDAPSSMDIAQGKSYSYTFNKAGTYTYHCFIHSYMHGTVVVTN